MRYVKLEDAGEDYRLTVDHADIPECNDHDVLIRVAYAGLNRADVYQALGQYGDKAGQLGLEISGTIIAMGGEVRSHSVGQHVCALLPHSGYAEYVSVPEWRVLPMPDGLSLKEAAALMEASCTVYRTVAELGELSPGQVFLVHGGCSAIGITAIQLAKKLGATVVTTAGDIEKCELSESLGADLAIPYKEQVFEDVIQERFGKLDLVLDMVGGYYMEKHLKLLRYGGRLVQIAFIEGARAELSMGRLLVKNLTWQGFTLQSQPEERIYQLAQSVRSILWPWFATGEMRVVIDAVYPMAEAKAAHARMHAFEHKGKILLQMFGED